MTVNELIMALKYEDPQAEVFFRNIAANTVNPVNDLIAEKKYKTVILMSISKEAFL